MLGAGGDVHTGPKHSPWLRELTVSLEIQVLLIGKNIKNQCILELNMRQEKALCGGAVIGLDFFSGSDSTVNSSCGLDTLFLFFRPWFSSL